MDPGEQDPGHGKNPVANADGDPAESRVSSPSQTLTRDTVRFVEVGRGRQPDFATEVAEGLGRPAGEKTLPYRFFYDARGSALFDRITELEEYYPTDAELSILKTHGEAIAASCGVDLPVVELGSGSATKARLLLPPFCAQATESLHYVPIDISRAALEENARTLRTELPRLRITAVVGEYRAGLAHLDEVCGRPRIISWLGGSIGNMTRDQASEFLALLTPQLGAEGSALVGVDLRKDRHVLERAYDDSEGVTAEFNKNLLHRMQNELGADVDVDGFRHVAQYDTETGRVAMFLQSVGRQTIGIESIGLEVALEDGERIHTESSFKYSFDEIEDVAQAAGLHVEERWLDRDRRFSLNRLVRASG